jgi:hypothetical protein|tara:strand:- start:2752 stop:3951 length:1200 start_codon:yes stop_codon:yes gene_type:complete
MAKAVDLFVIYQLLKRLTTPFDETEAYALGLIDERGKKLRSPSTSEEKDAYDLIDRFVFNIKRLIEKIPGGRTRLGSYAAALLLIKEREEIEKMVDNHYLIEQAWKKNLRELKKDMPIKLSEMIMEEPRIPKKKGQPTKSNKHSDLYTDEDPEGTIHGLKFATTKDAEESVKKIDKSDRTHAHKIQAAVAMEQRARVAGKNSAADVYRTYINKMKEITKKRKKQNEDAPSTNTSGIAGLTPSDLKVPPSAHKKYKERNKAQANTIGRKVMSLKTFTEERQITRSDLDQIEKYADKLFAKVGIDVNFTRHFLDRVNDERNKKQITTAELTRLFKQSYAKHGKKISDMNPDAEAVIKDMKTDVNMPFVLKYDPKNQEIDLVAKTVMRKKGFKTLDPELRVD